MMGMKEAVMCWALEYVLGGGELGFVGCAKAVLSRGVVRDLCW
ncbi:hypothetical protein [Bartonella refiksaydamii]|nr:hypothetical protein [Bartonella refiksaydamii]